MKCSVFGDIMLDIWVKGKVNRLSPEAPVPVLSEYCETYNLGGAANLAANLKNLNFDVDLYGFIGQDFAGDKILDLLNHRNINFKHQEFLVNTTQKKRFLTDSGNHLMRLDIDSYSSEISYFDNISDLIFISDYNKGAITSTLVSKLNQKNKTIFVDPKKSPDSYRDVFLIKPNLKEFIDWFGDFNIDVAKWAVKEYNWKYLIVTMGDQGCYLFTDSGVDQRFYQNKIEVSDVAGAGDVVLSILGYSLSQGDDIFSAVEKSMKGAGKVVEKSGISLINIHDFDESCVFANGCFDILHAGHFHLLKYCRSLGGKVIIGLNSDQSVKKLKGEKRPYNNENIRKQNLLSLPWVDEVIIFNEDTPLKLIEKLKPKYIVKGDEYNIDEVVGSHISEVKLIKMIDGFSTSNTFLNM